MQQSKRQADKAARTTSTDCLPDVNLIKRIIDLGSAAEYVEALVTALEHARGTVTTAEDFIETCLLLYSRDKLTPERVGGHLEEFRRNLHDTTDTVRHFIRQNSTEFADLCQAEAGRQCRSSVIVKRGALFPRRRPVYLKAVQVSTPQPLLPWSVRSARCVYEQGVAKPSSREIRISDAVKRVAGA